MKLSFFSNYYSHHQEPVCRAWDRLTGGKFTFVSTEAMTEERRNMGWGIEGPVPFELYYEPDKSELPFSPENCDVVIIGNAPMSLVYKRLAEKKLVFRCVERPFKRGYSYLKWLPRLYTFWKNYGRYSSLYLLAAGAFVSADYAMHGAFTGKSYCWGYFPETKCYELQALFAKKRKNHILWCGRFLDWKHPDAAIEIAMRLKSEGYDFSMNLIGTGELEQQLRCAILEHGLEERVRLLGAMKPEQVRKEMETAGIYIFTSDFQEGWGAVLNEAMNSGCAVVASHAIGSVPCLVKHGENGLVYENGNTDDLYRKVRTLLNRPDKQRMLGERAYRTITEEWNADVAAERFLRLAAEINDHGYCDLFESGPCSRAKIIKNNWFHEEDYDLTWLEN